MSHGNDVFMMDDDARPLFLVTNDDGYGAPGLEAMVAALEAWATVLVIAPSHEKSACSHQLTLGRPLQRKKLGPHRYWVDGTPADCVYLGLLGGERVSPRIPDLVVSGLNAGLNLGLDTYYSGTVAGAREAAMRGVPGMAVSAEPGADGKRAAHLSSRLAWHFLQIFDRAEPVVLNVNIPARGSWELRHTRLGRRVYGEGIEFRRSPRGREYFWIGGAGVMKDECTPGTDTRALHEGAIGVTNLPLTPFDSRGDDIIDRMIRAWQAEQRSER